MKARITEITSPWGMQQKKDGGTYGPAMKVHATLETGEEVKWLTLFTQRQISDEIEVAKKAGKDGQEYWNEVSQKAAQHEEIMGALRALYAKVSELEKLVKELRNGTD